MEKLPAAVSVYVTLPAAALSIRSVSLFAFSTDFLDGASVDVTAQVRDLPPEWTRQRQVLGLTAMRG